MHGRDCEKRALCLPSSLHGEHYTNFQWVMATGEKKKENYPRASHYTPTAVLDRVEYNNICGSGRGPCLRPPCMIRLDIYSPSRTFFTVLARAVACSTVQVVAVAPLASQHCHQCCVSRRRIETSKASRQGYGVGASEVRVPDIMMAGDRAGKIARRSRAGSSSLRLGSARSGSRASNEPSRAGLLRLVSRLASSVH